MEDFLTKLNKVKNHNQIIKLKRENELKDEKIEKITDGCKNILLDYEENKQKEIKELKNQIEKLEIENEKIIKEREFYKNSLNKIPKFILKIFVKEANQRRLDGE